MVANPQQSTMDRMVEAAISRDVIESTVERVRAREQVALFDSIWLAYVVNVCATAAFKREPSDGRRHLSPIQTSIEHSRQSFCSATFNLPSAAPWLTLSGVGPKVH